jgi:hypothetical protein
LLAAWTYLGRHSSFVGWVATMLLLPVSLYKMGCHALYYYTGTRQSEILPGVLCYREGQRASAPASNSATDRVAESATNRDEDATSEVPNSAL